jgi:hypothetical protein
MNGDPFRDAQTLRRPVDHGVEIPEGAREYRCAGVIQLNDACLDSFQYFRGSSLELLENAAFPFASGRTLKYR